MAEETWRVILDQGYGGDGDSSDDVDGTNRPAAETPQQRKQLFEDAGKVFAAIAGVSSILAVLIRSMQESTVFSTFMSAFIKVFSAMIDLFMVSMIPVLLVVLNFLLKFLPVAQELGQIMQPLFKQIADNLEKLLDAVVEWVVPRLTSLAEALVDLFSSGDIGPLMEWAEEFFKDLLELAENTFKAIFEWFDENGPKIAETIINIVTQAAEWIKEEGPNIINRLIDTIKFTQETLGPLIMQIADAVWPVVKQILAPLKEWLDQIGSWLYEVVVAPLMDLFNQLATWTMEQISVLLSNVEKRFIYFITMLVELLPKALLLPFTTKGGLSEENLNNLIEEYKKTNSLVMDDIKPFVADLKVNTDVLNSFPSLFEVLGAKIDNVSNTIAKADQNNTSAIENSSNNSSMSPAKPIVVERDATVNQRIVPDTNRWKARMAQMEAAGEAWW